MLRNLRNYLSFSLIASMIASIWMFAGIELGHVAANGTVSEIRILEITDSGASDLSRILSSSTNPTYALTTIKMKQFVAYRDELDGKYDAIYIGKGSYNSTQATTNEHNTTGIENDITLLKMNQLIDFYIDRGLPVIAYSQKDTNSSRNDGALYQKTAGILKSSLLKYSRNNNGTPTVDASLVPISDKENVFFVGSDDISTKAKFLAKTNLLANGALKPRLAITSKPVDYTSNQTTIYRSGDILTYRFDLNNAPNIAQGRLVANLYLGIDYVLKFGADQLVATQPVTSATANELTFRLPKGYSGVHYWKLEIVDHSTGLKDIQTGVLRFRDEITPIKVLQVLPDNGDSSSLLRTNNMRSSYLVSDDYAIAISVTDIGAFNNGGYHNLNGKYDMLIFGFTDTYNQSAPISQEASVAVTNFIKTGQSVMFTHDTIFQGNQNWITYFQQSTGQSENKTNMGLNAPQTSTTTKKVNEGLLTRFPFNISDIETKVNTTHDQYFRLKLEDEDLIPWYNITGGTRDNDDSWNHYYTYSYGNVTYSGTGHTNSNFPDWEQKLFVNTMYRAFIGSNHAPTVTVDSPADYSASGNVIPSYNDILVSYKASDFDLVDRTLFSSVTFKYKAAGATEWVTSQVVETAERTTGEVVTRSLPNPLPNGGDLIITVNARDKSGAIDSKAVTVKVAKVTANLEVSRTLSDNVKNNKIEKDKPVSLTYTITPKPIPYQPGIDASDLEVKNLSFKEIFPPKLEVNPSGVTAPIVNKALTGSLATGYTLTGKISNIQYRRSGNLFIAAPVTFQVVVTPRDNSNYVLANSSLSFTDFTVGSSVPVAKNLAFASLAFEAVTLHKDLRIDDVEIAKNDQSKLIPVTSPLDVSNKTYTWTSDNPSVVSVDANGFIRGISSGTARVTAVVKDGSLRDDGSLISATATIKVSETGLDIEGPKTVDVGKQIVLQVDPTLPPSEKVRSYTWELSSVDSERAQLSEGANATHRMLTGLEAGKVTVVVTAITTKDRVLTQSHVVEVLQPIALDLPAEIHIGKGQSRNLWVSDLSVDPANLKDSIRSNTSWSSSSPSVATVESNTGVVRGDSTGAATVTVQYKRTESSAPVTATVKILVVELTAPAEYTVKRGTTFDLSELISVSPASVSSDGENLSWSSDDSNDAINATAQGVVTANNSGVENVNVVYRQTPDGQAIVSRSITVNVVNLLLTKRTVYLNPQDRFDLKSILLAYPESLSAQIIGDVTWRRESGKTFLTVDSSGFVTANAVGIQKVYATYALSDGSSIALEVTIEINEKNNDPDDGNPNHNTGDDRY
ncbi:DUF5057 domain-containing protein [Cohnella lupini]|uniref:Ig-like protein group 2 n=1 Tax=Cohnella lupini TaxID=1294267 RepID=A0A3D9IJ79_9BACL|nr:DUF5057 domain-containing protein [Cohnella lupini]RED61707.1 Ig-like protein group 2 [Cohnella lupini]